MRTQSKSILKLIEKYIEKNPDQRFGQVLFNLNINQFDRLASTEDHRLLRDIYNDTDASILARIFTACILRKQKRPY